MKLNSALRSVALVSVLLCLGLGGLQAQPAGDAIDFNKARQLLERQRGGGTLTADERSYLERARAARRGGGSRGGNRGAGQRAAPARLFPLTDMSADDRYEGEEGGLYGGGRNTPPDALRQAAEVQLAAIRPLDAAGKPDAGGTIGFISISMSNATQEFARFKTIADRSALKSPHVTIVDCAQGGQAMAEWAPADAPRWGVAMKRLAAAKVSPKQVQVVWIKLANKAPTGSFQEHARQLEKDTLAVLRNTKAKFPNVRLAYLSSRTWGGYGNRGLNPEPYAYESNFVVRWLIQRQSKGDAALSLEQAPLLLWGPYLWAEGTRGRQVDSLVWRRDDFVADGIHPSDSGRQKVAELFMDFLTTNPLAKPWFARQSP